MLSVDDIFNSVISIYDSGLCLCFVFSYCTFVFLQHIARRTTLKHIVAGISAICECDLGISVMGMLTEFILVAYDE